MVIQSGLPIKIFGEGKGDVLAEILNETYYLFTDGILRVRME